jgi:AraC-like DNA-binding protein
MRQVRAVALTGFLEVARFVGLDGYRLLREAGLRAEILNEPENRIRAEPVINMLERAAEQSGCDSFGLLMISVRTFASLGPIALLLQHLDTVGDAVEAGSMFRRHMNDIVTIDLDRAGDTAMIRIGLSGLERRQALDHAIGMAYLALTGASAGRWAPDCVHLAHGAPRDLSSWRRMFAAPLEFDSGFSGFSCPASALGIGNPLANPEMARHARYLLRMVPLPAVDDAIAEQARRSILLLLPSGRVTLRDVARNLGMTSRTLQRQLEAEGHTFGRLLNGIRRDVVQRHLSGSNQTVSTISEMTGYNSLAGFSRWFGAEFGMSPKDWRAAHRAVGQGPPPVWSVG